ncbi:MAG: APC family permease [Leptospirales bacterium]|nr:APC family permease [Leptospirales bacterium]
MSADQSSQPELERRIGLRDAIVVIAGNMIGVGIFIMPPLVAGAAGNPWAFLFLWLAGGLIAFAGAMSSAELGILMPQAGGDYIFLKRTYGLFFGFLYGYLSLLFSYTGSIAAMATAVASYQGGTLFGSAMEQTLLTLPGLEAQTWSFQLRHAVACALVLSITLINHFGIMRGMILQRLATLAPAAALGIIAVAALGAALSGDASMENLRHNLNGPLALPGFSALGAGLLPVFFAFTGWNVTLYLAEDIKQPERNIPLSMIIGVAAVTALYLLFCLSLLASTPFESLQTNHPADVSALAAGHFLGQNAGALMAIVIALFIMSSLNTTILGGSRLYLAMARDRVFLESVGKLHRRFQTPHIALWLQAGLACLLILVMRNLDAILNLSVMVMLFLSMLTISCVFVLRRRLGAAHAVHTMQNKALARALGYPLLPVFYIGALAAIIASALVFDPGSRVSALAAGVMTVIGLVIFSIWRRNRPELAP